VLEVSALPFIGRSTLKVLLLEPASVSPRPDDPYSALDSVLSVCKSLRSCSFPTSFDIMFLGSSNHMPEVAYLIFGCV
jgi:hypothetical protein